MKRPSCGLYTHNNNTLREKMKLGKNNILFIVAEWDFFTTSNVTIYNAKHLMPYLYIPTAYISISFYAVYAKVIGSVRGSEQQQQRYILSTRTSLSCVYRNRTRLAWRQNDNVQATERALKGRRWINLLLFSFFLWLCLYIFHPGIVWPIYIYIFFFMCVCI